MSIPQNPHHPAVVTLTAIDITLSGNADSVSVIAMTVASGVALHASSTQAADAEPLARELASAPDAVADPIGHSGLSVVSSVPVEDHHDDNRKTDGDRAVSELMASLPWESRVSESDSPLDAVLSAFGHDRRCRRRVRSGLAVTCECSTRPPIDDSAIVIGLALRFARTGLSRRLPLPHGIVEQLARHVDEGDPAAMMVWEWLARRGLVAARPVPQRTPTRPALRLVCTTEEQ